MSERRDTALINIADYKHSTPIQIRFVDIDKMGHVNNATILSYFEIARTNFFDDVIGQQDNWFERGLIIAHTDIDYYAPVYLRDEVNAYVRIVKTGTKSFGIEHLLVKTSNSKEETICAVATTVLVCMDYTKKQTIAIPAEWKEKLQAFEN
jgi:acyl-CoA thioester hydrolase